MATLSVRDFRSQMGMSFDRVDAGEKVFIRRRNQLYTIVPVENNDTEISPALAEKIEKARQEHREGKTLRFESAEAARKWFDAL